jgi:uncharacterized protein (TIGR00645 family)
MMADPTPHARSIEHRIEGLLLAARWLLFPLYAALLLAMVAIYIMVGREMVLLFTRAADASESDVVLIVLAVLDLVLVSNLVVMVAISSFESFISKIDAEVGDGKPEWLGKLDSGNVKIKVALSIVMISAIHLLRAFMNDATTERLLVLAAVHAVFVGSALVLAFVDRIGKSSGAHEAGKG